MSQFNQSGDIEEYVSAYRDQVPLQNGTVPRSGGIKTSFMPSLDTANDDLLHAVSLARRGELDSARAIAALYGYAIIEYQDVGQGRARDYLIFREQPGENGACQRNWGMYIFAKLGPRGSSYGTPISIQIPHPLYDMETPQLGIRAFIETNADSFFIAGIHRYNTAASTKPATWSNADSSDMAHNEHSLFLKMADDFTRPAAYNRLRGLRPMAVVQVHGFGNSDLEGGKWTYNSKRAYPQIVLSNGDDSLQGKRVPILDRLSHELWKTASTGNGQKMTAGVYNGWEYSDLGATANVVGSRIRARGDGSTFIHIETDPSIRVTNGWAKVRQIDVRQDRIEKYRRFGRTLKLVLGAEDGPGLMTQKL